MENSTNGLSLNRFGNYAKDPRDGTHNALVDRICSFSWQTSIWVFFVSIQVLLDLPKFIRQKFVPVNEKPRRRSNMKQKTKTKDGDWSAILKVNFAPWNDRVWIDACEYITAEMLSSLVIN